VVFNRNLAEEWHRYPCLCYNQILMDLPRRNFVKTAALTALSQGRVPAANDRIRIGLIGAGGRGRYLAGLASQAPGTEIVAVCDVYQPRRADVKQKLAPQAREYLEYRELLEQKDIDAVIIGSPDHGHVPMVIDAIGAGKDAYVEKPISHSIEEGENLRKAFESSKQVVQVGYQQRSWDHFRQARDIIADGKLGTIALILTSWYQPYVRTIKGPPPKIDAQKLDWKRFLGSAPDQPFNPLRFRFWRWFWDFGGGHLTDLYSHYVDVIHWVMGADTPLDAQAMGSNFALPNFECPDTICAGYHYPKQFSVAYDGTLIGSLEGGNLVFRGSRAMMKLNRDGLDVYPEGVVPFEKTTYPPPEIHLNSEKDGTIAHMANFLECIRSRKTPNAPVEVGIAAARAAHLGNQAFRSGKTVKWPG
jgi:predicted dehydrogenase